MCSVNNNNDAAPTASLQPSVLRLLRRHISADPHSFFDEADADQGEDLDVDDLKGLGKKKDSKATDESASVEGGAG